MPHDIRDQYAQPPGYVTGGSNSAAGGGASFVGTSSNLTLGDGSAGIVPAGNFGNLSAADIPNLAASKITTGQLALARGGTNADLSATGGTGQVLKQTSAGGAVTVAALTAGDIPAPTFAGIVCSKTSGQAISANTATDITFTIERVAESAHLSHSTSSSPAEITVNTAGKYRISGRVVADTTSGSGYDNYFVYLLKNGTIIAQARYQGYQPAIAPATTPGTFDWVYDLAQNDVIKLQAFAVNNAFNVAGLTSSRDQTFLSMVFLGV